jgi:Undecaprenyl-phosphate glucose phosphotransferase
MPHAAVLTTHEPMSAATELRHAARADALPSRKQVALSRRVVGDLLGATTVVAASAAVWASAVMMAQLSSPFATVDAQAAAIGLGCLIILAQFAVTMRLNRTEVSVGRDAIILAVGGALAAGTATFIAMGGTPSATSVSVTLLLAATGGVAAGSCRLLLSSVVAHSPFSDNLRRRVAVYGASQDSARAFEQFAKEDGQTFFMGLFDDRADESRQDLLGIPVSGSLDDLIRFAQAGALDEIIIALPHWARERTQDVAGRLSEFPVDVHVPVETAKDLPQVGQTFHLSRFGSVQYAQVQRTPLRDWAVVAKLAQDRIGGAILLLGLSPVFALIAAAIKLDSAGPVFFRQKRHGLCGREITVWKFRTMRVMEDGAVIKQASRDDDRITRVGRILRKTSLDELPQLINVVLGEMSIVGPRPHAIAHNQYYAQFIEAYNGRNQMKPGITGWAQVNGYRGETKAVELMEKRIEHDLWYIRNWSIWLDIKIILLTPIYGLVHKNAY